MLLMFGAAPTFAAVNKGETSNMKFDENGNFRILIIADPQDSLNTRQEAIDLMNAALDETKPDLVVLIWRRIYIRVMLILKNPLPSTRLHKPF